MSKITKTSQKGIDLIKKYEGLKLKPYLCPANVATIGYGTIRYPNGQKVSINDREIRENEAEQFLKHDLIIFENAVDAMCTDTLNQNQFDALVSFCYNLGQGNLKSSTLLKKVNINPNDSSIRDEFIKWTRANGKSLPGLTSRRKSEADLYFTI